MAVYRSDQAQVTFMTEAGPGGYIETHPQATATSSGGIGTLTATTRPGASEIAVTVTANTFEVGDTIQIEHGTATKNNEIRDIEHITGTTFYLSAPTAFYHASGASVKQIVVDNTSAEFRNADHQFINLIPGAYETVDVPDPEMAIEGRWFLGTASKRDFFAAYSGQQTFAGSIGGFALLNGKSLRYPIGRVNSKTTFINVAGSADPTYGMIINQAVSPKKGDTFVTVDTAYGSVPTNTILWFSGSTTHGASTSTTAEGALSAPVTRQEIRKHIGSASATTLELAYPLQFDHADDEFIYAIVTVGTGSGTTVGTPVNITASAPIAYTHTISETVDLDSVSWNVHMLPSDESRDKAFDRRYFGGKIGSMSISAEEGAMATASWDSVNFLGMVHNQKTVDLATDITTPFFANFQSIVNADVVGNFPTTEPYYFSNGEVSMFGQTIARIRSFSLTIANNEEPRYYIKKQMGRRRGPTEIREQRREYSLAVTLALPDAAAANSAQRTLFQEMLLEGNYGSPADLIRSGKSGFDVDITLTRGNVVTGFEDKITFSVPATNSGGNDAAGTSAAGGNAQGAFIRTAPHNITEDNPFQVEADILFRNMSVIVQDSEHYYP